MNRMTEAKSDYKRGATLSASGLLKNYDGVRALDRVTVAFSPGEVTGLIGANGAGKTTLIDVITGFTRADSGEICFCSENITGRTPEAIGRLGVVRTFQNGFPPESLTVREYLSLGTLCRSWIDLLVPPSEPDEWQKLILDDVNQWLQHWYCRPEQPLPLGLSKLMVVARAFLRRPRVLLLDEPTQHFDNQWTDCLCNWVKALAMDGASIIVVTHDFEFLLRVTDRIVSMSNGRIDEEPAICAQRINYPSGTANIRSSSGNDRVVLRTKGLKANVSQRQGLEVPDLTLRSGELLAVIGPNGSGKSSVLAALAGLIPHSGTLIVGDSEVKYSNAPKVPNGVAMVMQGARLPKRLTVEQSLVMAANNGWTPRSAGLRSFLMVTNILTKFGALQNRKGSLASSLSAGERQMLAIGMGLAQMPEILILDEPSVGLHPEVRECTLQILAEFRGAGGLVIVGEQEASFIEGHAQWILRFMRSSFQLELAQPPARRDQ